MLHSGQIKKIIKKKWWLKYTKYLWWLFAIIKPIVFHHPLWLFQVMWRMAPDFFFLVIKVVFMKIHHIFGRFLMGSTEWFIVTILNDGIQVVSYLVCCTMYIFLLRAIVRWLCVLILFDRIIKLINYFDWSTFNFIIITTQTTLSSNLLYKNFNILLCFFFYFIYKFCIKKSENFN